MQKNVAGNNSEYDMSRNDRGKGHRHFWGRFFNEEMKDLKSAVLWRACFTEFVATLLLCFYHVGLLFFMPGSEPPELLHVAIGHGLYVATVVTALGATSGCHMNPAVTVAFITLRKITLARACLYIVSQCFGAIIGTIMLKEISNQNMTGNLGLISPGLNISDKQAICTEVIITAFLLVVVMATEDNRRSDIQGSVPLIIGLTIVVNTLLANKVSGSCMNPARALGPAVVMSDYTNMMMYWLGPCCGAVVGAHLYTWCLAPAASAITSRDGRGDNPYIDDGILAEKKKILFSISPETDL